MNIKLEFIKESGSAEARLYRFKDGRELWIPRSVVTKCLKWPQTDLTIPPVHELSIEDWWAEKEKL
jgi:hypothetical protein